MPIVKSSYKPPLFFKNGHIATTYSGLLRRVRGVSQERERIGLRDDDILYLDWSYSLTTTSKLVIVLHGLEGNAQRPYMLGTAKHFNVHGYDTVCVNFRGCTGEENKQYRSYHSGATDDLEDIIQFIINEKNYSEIYLKGFSLGGNIVLKYLGESNEVPEQIKGAMAVSVPCYLSGSAKALHKLENKLYAEYFLLFLKKRLKIKQEHFPSRITKNQIRSIKTLYDFDNIYTSKAHGFKDAEDYYSKCSSLQFLSFINVPTLILNAKDDSFLSLECYPIKEAETNSNVYLEIPKYGGHVGFYDKANIYYNESVAFRFFKSLEN